MEGMTATGSKECPTACRRCSQSVAQAHAPEHVVPGGLPTELFIASIIVSKFGDHLPFYRQAEIFKRQGIDLDRGTLGNWVGRAFRGLTPPHWGDGPPQLHLMPVINHMRAHLRGTHRIFVDEIRAPVLEPGLKRTKSGYFWAVVSDDRGHGGAGPPIVVRALLRTDGSRALVLCISMAPGVEGSHCPPRHLWRAVAAVGSCPPWSCRTVSE